MQGQVKNGRALPRWGIGLIAVIMVAVSANLNWGKKAYWEGLIKSDGKGYYAYLPAVFIYHDLNFAFFDSLDRGKYYSENGFYDYRIGYEGKVIDKYYCGTAVAQLPFFAAAHAVTKISGGEADGYSKWYQVGINIAAVCWLLFGLFYLDNTLWLYGLKAADRTAVLFAAVFGTHLFYYTLSEPALSHVYSFAFVCWFVYLAKAWFVSSGSRYLPCMALALGMIVLIRPVNGLVVSALPFLAGGAPVLRGAVRNAFRHPLLLTASLLVFVAVTGIQLLEYKISTGTFFVYSYGGETFHFAEPHMWDILFSYRKGLFLYTPLLFVSLAGLWFLREKPLFGIGAWLFFFVPVTYVLSSWWMWYYGGSFSSRVYVEYIPMFMLLLGICLRELAGAAKRGFMALLFLLVALCQVQTYQYRYYQIHWSDMDREKYWEVFLRPDRIGAE